MRATRGARSRIRFPRLLPLTLGAFAAACSGQDSASEPATEPVSRPIVQGFPAQQGAFPGMAALFEAQGGDDGEGGALEDDQQFCGGALVGPRWILTAAHCVMEDDLRPRAAERMRVVLDRVDIGQLARDSRQRLVVDNLNVFDVFDVVVHPRFVFTAGHDVALLRLGAAARPRPYPLIKTGDEERRFASPGRPAIIAGWGATDVLGDESPRLLQNAVVPVLPRWACDWAASLDAGSEYTDEFDSLVDTELCVGGLLASACYGDSGGPLFVRTPAGMAIAGVVSHGYQAECALDRPAAFARMSRLSSWVAACMRDPSGCPRAD